MNIILINPKQIVMEQPEEHQNNKILKAIYYIEQMVYKRGKRAGSLWHPLGLLYIASNLQKHGHNVELIDLNFQKFKNDINGIVGVSFDGDINKNFIENLRRYKSKGNFIIAGGYEATFNYPKILNDELADLVVLGEGESTILELLEKININKSWKNTRGIAYKDKDKIIVNSPGIINNLDIFPLPDRELIDIKEYKETNEWVNLITSRGCPNHCAFCKKFNISYRTQSIEKTIKEIKILYDYGYRYLLFADNRFSFFKERVMKLCAIIRKYFLDMSWCCLMHVSDCDEALLKIMKASGCKKINIGIESFNQKTLDIINKGFNIKQIEKVFKICRKIGMETSINLILGLPYENPKTFFKNLVKYSLKFRPNRININILRASCSFSTNELTNFGSSFQINPEKFGLEFLQNNATNKLESIGNIKFSSFQKMFPITMLYCLAYNIIARLIWRIHGQK